MMTWSRRLGLILCFLSGHAVAANQCPDPQDTRCKSLPGNAVQWTIHEPDVRLESLKDYPDIRFEKGQTVMVYADGCVNVSKDENRPLWKEYMEPTGGGIDRHYHGLIWIPGARVVKNGQHLAIPVGTTPVRIGSVAGRKGKTDPVELIIDDPPPGVNPTLRLGYEEAGDHRFSCLPQGTCPAMYPQHPYDPPVPGAGQCKSKATVIVEIYSGPPPQGEPPDHLKPFDVVSSEVDENGFLFAPHWNNVVSSNAVTDMGVSEECNNFPYKHWYLVRRGIDSQCSQQTSFDVPKTFTECLLAPGFGELHGHVNWAPATFVGKLSFVEVSADKDVDMQLKTIGDRVLRFPGNKDFGKIAPILTKDSQESAEYRDALWLEYATYETTNYFKPPWNQIRFTSHPQDLAKLKGDLQDKTAIATGLLNLDCVHDCHTELHPVFAMAIRTESELATGIAHHDPWMIFVRNQGNQGDCSLDQHYLGRDSYTFFLPAPPGASPGMPVVENPDSAFSSNQQGLTWSMERSPEESSNGVLLHFSFTADENACESLHRGEMTHLSGLLCLNWTGPSATSPSECKAFWGDATNAKPLTPDKTQIENNPVLFVSRSQQTYACKSESEDLIGSQNTWSETHRKNGPDLSFPTIVGQVRDLLGSDFGIFEELLFYNKTSQIQPNVGGRLAVIQTPLGSLEVDGAPGLSRRVRSSNGQNLNVNISDWMAGLKVQFTRQLNLFAEVKGGQIFRSASAGYRDTPDFNNFHGHNDFFLAGGGIQPGNNVRAGGTRITLRISVDYLHVFGTGENMVRITIGPQFQIHKKIH